MMASTVAGNVSTTLAPLLANLSRSPRCLRARAWMIASAYNYTSTGRNRFIGMDIIDPTVDYLALAASFGVPARRVERAADISGAVEAGIASGRPNFIDVVITP